MRKFWVILMIILIVLAIPILGFGYAKVTEPNTYYKVYYEGQTLGVISSAEELEKYINNNGKVYKNKYDTDEVYAPNGVQVKKLVTYDGKLDSVKEVYKKIKDEDDFTIKGYDMAIKKIKEK